MKQFIVVLFLAIAATAQQMRAPDLKPLFPDDPRGLRLPPGEPRMVDTNGNVVWIDENYTTPQYHEAALRSLIGEANKVAEELRLPEKLPITEGNITQSFIAPFGYNYLRGTIGNVATTNYIYCVAAGDKFCYLEDLHRAGDCARYQKQYLWPIDRLDTNQAYLLATQWLNAVSMDVSSLNRDFRLIIEPYRAFPFPKGKFIPVYEVAWIDYSFHHGVAADVVVFTPEEKLLSMRVEDPRYILRKPVAFRNLNALLPGPSQVFTNRIIFNDSAGPN